MLFSQLPADIQSALNMDALYVAQLSSNVNDPAGTITSGARISLKSPALAQSLMAHQGFQLVSAEVWFNQEAAPSTDAEGLQIAQNAIAATAAGV